MIIILEIGGRFPWIHVGRRPPTVYPQIPSGESPASHRSYVRTARGIGWIHHHTVDGWAVEYPSGDVLIVKDIENISPEQAKEG